MDFRKICLILLCTIAAVVNLQAQTPQKFAYQAVARLDGQLLANEQISIKFTIKDLGNTTYYQETHVNVTTNAYGLFRLFVGDGVPVQPFSTTSFDTLSWDQGPFTLQVELKDNGSTFLYMGESQLVSVPYALYAQKAHSVENLSVALEDLTDVIVPAPKVGEVLTWDGAAWVAQTSQGGGVANIFPGAGIAISNDSVINTGDLDPSDDITNATPSGGDVTGNFPTLSVVGIAGNPIDSTASFPSHNDVLKWDAIEQAWVAKPDSLANGPGIPQLGASQGQVLKWINGAWIPYDDSVNSYGLQLVGDTLRLLENGILGSSVTLPNNTYSPGPGISISGGTIANIGDTDSTNDLTHTTPFTGDISNSYQSGFEVIGLLGHLINSPGPFPGDGYVLKFDLGASPPQWQVVPDEIEDSDADPSNELQVLSKSTLNGKIQLNLSDGGNFNPTGGGIVTLNAGEGISFSGDTIVNEGILPTQTVGGDLTGNLLAPNVIKLRGRPIALAAPVNGQLYQFDGTQWVAVSAGGDISGPLDNINVDAIQGIPLSTQAPSAGEILKFNSGQWSVSSDLVDDADADPVNEIQSLSIAYSNDPTVRDTVKLTEGGNVELPSMIEGDGIEITYLPGGIRTLANTGDLDDSDDVLISDQAGGDLTGTFSNLAIKSIQGRAVDAAAPGNGNILKFDGSTQIWEPAPDENTEYTAGAGLNLNGTEFINTGDRDSTNDVLITDQAGGDLSGVFSNLTVSELQGNELNAATPAAGEILKYDGASGQWQPAVDNNTEYTAGAGLDLNGTEFINTGDRDSTNDVLITDQAGGDLSGVFSNLTVSELQGNELNAATPAAGEILKYDGASGQWQPAVDNNTEYTAGAGLDLNGTEFINTGDRDSTNDVLITDQAGGDLSGVFSNLTVSELQGNELNAATPAAGEILKYDGASGQWQPAVDNNTEYTAGAGLDLNGTEFINTGDRDSTNDVLITDQAGGDLSGVFSNLTVSELQGNELNAATPAAGEILKYDGASGQWQPAVDNNTEYTAGAGLDLNGTEFINTGDRDSTNDVLITDLAGGDLSGVFSNLTVSELQGNELNAAAPAAGEILKYDGASGQWQPAVDNNTEYTAGAGLDLNGTEFINTGDRDSTNDVLITDQAGGDLSGVFSNLTVSELQGNELNAATPAAGEILKYDGASGQWQPAVDNNTEYTAGAGLDLNGTEFINTGDRDSTNDVLITDQAGGDLSGVFSNLTVSELQGNELNAAAPAAGEILKYDGASGQWQPAVDNNTEYTAGAGLDLNGTEFINTGDRDSTNDVLITDQAGGDLSGVFSNLTVSELQGNELNAATPAAGEILKYDGASGQWQPAVDNNTEYTAGAGLDLNGTEFINTGDRDSTNDVLITDLAGGDLSGVFSNLQVSELQGIELNAATPAAGEILKYDGASGQWQPAVDNNTEYTAGAGLDLNGTEFINTGDRDSTNDVLITDLAGGDLSGTFSNLTVSELQGNTLDAPSPLDGQVLKYNNTTGAWEPSNENNPAYTAGAGIDLTGGVITNTGDTDASDDLTTSTTFSGDVDGTYNNTVVEAIQGFDVATTTPSTDEVLKWNGTAWEPAADSSAEYTAGTGIDVTGTVITNTGDTDASDDLTTFTTFSGDVDGTYNNTVVEAIQGFDVATTTPSTDEVLKWNGTAWEPASDSSAEYTAGTGIDVTGTVITNTGDTDASDDLTTSTTFSGDVDGTYNNTVVEAIQGFDVATTTPSTDEVLKWNGTAWEPAADSSSEYTAGTGIDVTGTVITNTGDTDASDDLTTSTTFSGDVDGTYNNTVVEAIQGFDVATTTPSTDEVLKWNGTAWEPASDSSAEYTAGTGIDVTGTVITNTGDTDASDDLTTSTTFSGDVDGTYNNTVVEAIQGFDVATTTPSTDEVLKWNGTAWEPASDSSAEYTAGTGIDVTGTVITNTGDTDASDDLTTSTIFSGDVDGTYNNTVVEAIQGFDVATTTPSTDEVLKWNGTAWEPASDSSAEYTAGTGIDVTGTVITNTGDTDASDDLTTSTTFSGDVDGTYNNTVVEAIQGFDVATTTPSTDEVLKWNGTAWEPASDSSAAYTAGTGIDVTGTVITNTGDTDASDDLTTSTTFSGDVDGTYNNTVVEAIQGFDVASTTPSTDEVLKWNGTAWEPASDSSAAYTAGTGIDVSGTVITNTGDTDASDDLTTSTTFSGDVDGTYNNTVVEAIQGFDVATTTPSTDEVLKWNGTAWEPAADSSTEYTAGTGIDVTGGVITNTGDTDASDDLTTSTTFSGDVDGTYNNTVVEAIQGFDVATTTPAADEVLKWNGTAWEPASDSSAAYTAGTGIDVSGTVITNTGDTDASDDLTTSTTFSGDVDGTYNNTVVEAIQGFDVANTTPTSDEVLKWNGSEWEPSTDANTEYSAGTGIDVTGTVITNTGDTDASDDLTTGTTFSGDVTGNYNSTVVEAIQGFDVATTTPASNQVLKWNGTQWAPGDDDVEDGDTDDSNELQTLSYTGTVLTISDGNSVNIPVNPYTGGAGIAVSGNTIVNIGDTDASDDLTTSTTFSGDVTGNYNSTVVEAIQGFDVATTAPSTDQVLKWNGTAWEPAADSSVEYTAGTGIDVTGTTITNTGDTDASDDLTTGTTFSGDVTGNYNSTVVEAIQGFDVATTTPATDEVLKWNGTAWEAASDSSTVYTAGTGIDVTGTTITNTGDTDASDDLTTGTTFSGDVTGNYNSTVVEAIQGFDVATTTPTTDEVLKWNGTAWEAASDSSTVYTAGTGIDVTGTTITNTGDTDASDDLTTGTTFSGDVTGNYNSTVVEAIQGFDVATTTPATDEVLKWNGTAWEAASDSSTVYTAGTGIDVTGTTITNTGDTDASDDLTTGTTFSGDVTGNYNSTVVEAIQGFYVATTTPATDEVLKWNGTAWEAASDSSTVYTAGTGIDVTGTTITNTGDTDASDDLTTGTTFSGDVTGNYNSTVVEAIQGFDVATTTPATDEVLKWNGTAWEAASDSSTVYTAGTGIDVTGTTITNTGDTDASDDLTTGTAFSGDVSGTYNAISVEAIQGVDISMTTPDAGEVLAYNGTEWTADSLENAQLMINTDFIPDLDNSISLGSTTNRWTQLFAVNPTINTSDLRAKKDIQPIAYGLDAIMSLRPVSYQWMDRPNDGNRLGFIAQEMMQVMPEVVASHKLVKDPVTGEMIRVEMERYGLRYTEIIPVMVKGMQEQQEVIEQQAEQIEQQQSLIEDLARRLEALENQLNR
ncbi:tail fiber domain-containing protein [Pontibacter sp. G13]|uniref:tail fiber domain-containing protein n=1 Tax=Pontibacter sp. G13 TaxID=3074898 RepID=UPI00288AC282|nr:tail fiber domain-containing protein [Pontibacter sp. G13]WNJ19200.1 tail fiber domain-containing protein [Pontibacter sp. G13]